MTPLHQLGELLRQAMQTIPLSIVRLLFVGTLVVVLVWVLNLPRSAVVPPGGPQRRGENLKIGATAALLIQILIYCWL